METKITAQDVREYKNRTGKTLEEISREVGVSQQQVWMWTNDKAQPSKLAQKQLAKIIKD